MEQVDVQTRRLPFEDIFLVGISAARVPERGGQKTERLRVMIGSSQANNDFLLVSQFSVTGE
jgi:hypothetical protein